MLTAMEWFERVARMRRWTRGGERDPHRALLLLLALGELHRRGYAPLRYRDVEEPLGELLAEFGPAKPVSPGYTFHQLAADGLWEVLTQHGVGSPGPDAATLRAYDAAGRLTPRFAKELMADPAAFTQIVRLLLQLNFEPGLHDDLRTAVGLPPEPPVPASVAAHAQGLLPRARPDVLLRQKVLVAYDCRCAFCGFEGWMGNGVVGLDAARLRWWAFDGYDDLSNALCLCTLHHRLLDRGVLSLTRSGAILVSRHFVGTTESARTLVTSLVGRKAAPPKVGFPGPHRDNIDWHARQVFRGPARTS
jgi:putative restriction endonuclease